MLGAGPASVGPVVDTNYSTLETSDIRPAVPDKIACFHFAVELGVDDTGDEAAVSLLKQLICPVRLGGNEIEPAIDVHIIGDDLSRGAPGAGQPTAGHQP